MYFSCLHRELGLLRQRSQSSNGSKKSLVSNQIFSYLIVIDFESTCWREKNNYGQEIIEFPAVLLNTSTGEVESEFHTYVQPQEHPTLSDFCTELTGITQMQVEAGIPLQICLSRFSRWLQNLRLNMGVIFSNIQQRTSATTASQKLCTFLTWSDWDLGVCLQYECKRKQLHKPDVLNSWIDLRSTYRLFYARKPKGLNGALQDLGIQFSGREHSGLDDARNTAHLAARMMRDGCVMKITRSLVRVSEKSNTNKEENTLTTDNPSVSNIPPRSCQMKSGSGLIRSGSDPKDNTSPVQESVQICQSLISPKTLLNGSTTPLWGRSTTAKAATNIPSLVMRNCPSSHINNNNSLVLCSTTVSCLSNQTLTKQADNNFKTQKMTVDSSTTSLSTKKMKFSVNVSSHEIRQHSTISEPESCFAVPKTPKSKLNQHKTGFKTSLRVQGKLNGPHDNAKTNTPFPFRHHPFMPEKTSTPNSSFARPKAVITPHTNHKMTPQSSFTIYTDPGNSSRTSSCGSFITSKNVLSSLSTNTLSSRTNQSSLSAPMKGGQRVTSPLCGCGRRAKRQVVSNGGPNQGRGFYCCPVRRSGSGGRIQKGCEFFKWESALMKSSSVASPAVRSSVSLCQINSRLSCRPPQRSTIRKSY
uniref:GRF-type domain-containing protein n=1 Tax=Sparus aurata TaxID=8175 RepID=A0A671TQJ2_SPAAU